MEVKISDVKAPRTAEKTAYIRYRVNDGALISRTLYKTDAGSWVLKRKKPVMNLAGKIKTHQNVVWHDFEMDDYETVRLMLDNVLYMLETAEIQEQKKRGASLRMKPLPHKVKPPVIGLTEEQHAALEAERQRRGMKRANMPELLKQLLVERINQLGRQRG